MIRAAIILAFCCLAVPAQADYRFVGDRYVQAGTSAADVNRAMRCPPPHCGRGAAKPRKPRQPRRKPGSVSPLTLASTTILGGRPAGCPSRFCGCGASLHVFGRIIPTLNLAANWLRFPRTSPAPNMVAARRGHVFVLKQQLAGNVWMVFDANSGGHRTRIHPRSIAGYAIVNPRGA